MFKVGRGGNRYGGDIRNNWNVVVWIWFIIIIINSKDLRDEFRLLWNIERLNKIFWER